MARKSRKHNRQHQVRVYVGWLRDYDPSISTKSHVVYEHIAIYCDWQTGKGCPTFKTISKSCGLSIYLVREAVRELETAGLITTDFRKAVNAEGNEYGRKRYFYELTHKPTKPYFRSDNSVRKRRKQ